MKRIFNSKIFVLLAICSLFLISCTTTLPPPTFTPAAPTPVAQAAPQPKNIALLLPLNGSLATSGKAIRDGFMAAYYYGLQHGVTDVNIKIVDTSQGNITDLYQNAVQNGADFIVGPLTKDNVKNLTNIGSLPVTTIALNTLDNYPTYAINNLYQFGLYTGDEASQVAEYAWKNSPGNAVIIVPEGAWGNYLAAIMQKTWESQGGSVVKTLQYNSLNLADQIRDTLNIDQSQNRAKELLHTIYTKFKFLPQRRNDINSILMVALPKQARQIKPLLKFYFAGNIPVYATSAVYSGTVNQYLDQDLNGIYFCDIPWIFTTNLSADTAAIKQNITNLWPNSLKHSPQLYALGVDAFFLCQNLNQLLANPNNGIAAATGSLYIDQYRHIYRKLIWAQVVNGQPKII